MLKVPTLVAVIAAVLVMLLLFPAKDNINNMLTDTTPTCNTTGTLSTVSSSVWCSVVGTKTMCTFRNLCYAPPTQQFLFVLTNESVISGINNKNNLKSLDIGAVVNHNGLNLNIAMVSDTDNILTSNITDGGSVFMLWRFKWDNIMHVLHDDLMPLYFTYEHICSGSVNECASKYHLIFVDGGDAGPLYQWYKLFSALDPQILHRNSAEGLICFSESKVGLLQSSTWYQYGFGIPQGPVTNSQLSGAMVRQFTSYVFQKLGIVCDVKPAINPVLFFSRKINRKILNEGDVILMIQTTYKDILPLEEKVNVVTADISINDTKSIVQVLSQCKLVVGMHGSAMALSLFLRPGSAVVELFPFGISPENVSPVKALCDIPSFGVFYESWINANEENSVTHPEAAPLLGGIQHLPEHEQKLIKATTDIPAVQCCHDSAYLFRMFQDTYVSRDLATVLLKAVSHVQQFSVNTFWEGVNSETRRAWYFPGPVTNVACNYSANNDEVVIYWNPAVNAPQRDVQYDVAVRTDKQISTYVTKQLSLKVGMLPSTHQEVAVWVKCIVDNEESVDSFTACART